MRLGTVLTILSLICICAGPVLADKAYEAGEKPWHPNFPTPRAIVPENEGVNNVCPGQLIYCGDEVNPAALSPGGDYDWYSFDIAAAGDQITIGTDSVGGSTTDTFIELYDACGGAILISDDDSGPGFFSMISAYPAPHAGTYIVAVRGFSSTTTGAYKLNLTCVTPPPPPADDTCDGARDWARCTSGTLTGDLSPYSNNYDPGDGGCTTGYAEQGKDQAVRLNLNAGDIVSIVYTGLAYDAAIYIVTDCSNPAGSCVVGADDTVTGEAESINWVSPGGVYYLILDAFGLGSGGPYVVTYDISCPPPTAAAGATWGKVKAIYR